MPSGFPVTAGFGRTTFYAAIAYRQTTPTESLPVMLNAPGRDLLLHHEEERIRVLARILQCRIDLRIPRLRFVHRSTRITND